MLENEIKKFDKDNSISYNKEYEKSHKMRTDFIYKIQNQIADQFCIDSKYVHQSGEYYLPRYLIEEIEGH